MSFLAWPNPLHVNFKRSDSVTIYLATLSLCRNITCLSCVCLSLCSSRHFCDRTNSLHLVLQIFRKSLLNRSHLMLGDILMSRHLSASKNFFLRPVSYITRCSATCIGGQDKSYFTCHPRPRQFSIVQNTFLQMCVCGKG